MDLKLNNKVYGTQELQLYIERLEQSLVNDPLFDAIKTLNIFDNGSNMLLKCEKLCTYMQNIEYLTITPGEEDAFELLEKCFPFMTSLKILKLNLSVADAEQKFFKLTEFPPSLQAIEFNGNCVKISRG